MKGWLWLLCLRINCWAKILQTAIFRLLRQFKNTLCPGCPFGCKNSFLHVPDENILMLKNDQVPYPLILHQHSAKVDGVSAYYFQRLVKTSAINNKSIETSSFLFFSFLSAKQTWRSWCCSFVRSFGCSNVEKIRGTEWPSDQMTKLPTDQVTKWPSDRVTKWPSD